MKNFGVLFRSGLLRSRKIFVLVLAVSLGVSAISIVVSASATGGDSGVASFNLGFADRDDSAASKDMEAYFEDVLGVGLVKTNDTEALYAELMNKRISGVAEIPEGFQNALLAGTSKPVELTFLGDYENEAFVRGYFDAYMGSLAVLSAAADGDAARFEALLAQTDEAASDVKTARRDAKRARRDADKESYWFMLGLFMMLSFMMSIALAQMLHTDRLDGTFRRIKASRVTSAEYVASVAGVGFVMTLIFEGPALLIWQITGSYSGVPFGVTVLMLLAFAVLVNSFAIFIGVFMPSFSGIIAVGVAVSTITSMLGGAWFPLEWAPPLFQALSKFTPQYWLYKAIYSYDDGSGMFGTSFAAYGDGGGSFGLPLAILLLVSLLLLILTGIRFSGGSARTLAR